MKRPRNKSILNAGLYALLKQAKAPRDFGRACCFFISDPVNQTPCVCNGFPSTSCRKQPLPLTPVHAELTREITGDDRLLHQLTEDDKYFGWNQITFDVHILLMPLLKAF